MDAIIRLLRSVAPTRDRSTHRAHTLRYEDLCQ